MQLPAVAADLLHSAGSRGLESENVDVPEEDVCKSQTGVLLDHDVENVMVQMSYICTSVSVIR